MWFNWTLISASQDVCSVSCFCYYPGKHSVMALRCLEKSFAKQRSALTQSPLKESPISRRVLAGGEVGCWSGRPPVSCSVSSQCAHLCRRWQEQHRVPVPFTEGQPRGARCHDFRGLSVCRDHVISHEVSRWLSVTLQADHCQTPAFPKKPVS